MSQRTVRRREFLLRATGLVGLGLLAACAPAPAPSAPAKTEAKPTEAPKPAAQPTTAPAAKTEAKPTEAAKPAAAPTTAQAAPAKTGAAPTNTFTLAVRTDPPSIDPGAAADLPGRIVIVQAYEGLMRYEGKPPKPVPHLAESVTPSPDGKVYTVKLRPGLKFHDGSELDAEAVVFSMDRVLKMNKGPAAAFRALLKPGDTKAVDKLTVQFNLSQPSAVFPTTLPFFFIVNPKVVNANKAASGPYGADGDLAEQYLQTNDAGSGPYRLKSRTPNAELVFEAFPDYWRGWKENQYGTFTYKIVPEPPTAALLARQGQVDGVYEFYASNIFDELGNAQNVQVKSDLGVKPLYIFMNNQVAPTNNPQFRQAIAYAFDYRQAVSSIMSTQPDTQRLPGPLPQTVWSAIEKSPYDTDLEKAKSLLAQSGVRPGDVTLTFGASGGPADVRTKVALLVQANLAPLGINVDISQNTWADMVQQMSKPETTKHMYGVYLSYDYGDPDALLFPGWHSSGHGAWSGSQWYKNTKVDELIEQGRTTLGDDKRLPIYQEIQQTIVADSPCVFVFNEPVRVALNKNVGGYDYIIGVYNYSVYNLFKQA